MEGGEDYIEKYLVKYSSREDDDDFTNRKLVTPVPGFAAAAIIDIKNAIFQRLDTITRTGGSVAFNKVMTGQLGGVDLHESTMTHFIGREVLPELLFMGKVGVYIDMPELMEQPTLAQSKTIHPYYYLYRAEQIRNWELSGHNVLDKVLLEENFVEADDVYGLPKATSQQFRFVERINGQVRVRFFTRGDGKADLQVDQHGNPTTEDKIIDIDTIPFVIFELDRSLLKDIANHQIALLNMGSSDVSYSLQANFPFYTEQKSGKQNSNHLKDAEDGDETISVGSVQGRSYPTGMDRPKFIHPSAEPLTASMEKQKTLQDDIRTLVNLALSAITPKFASAESKTMDERGLESGLSFLGLILEHGERQLAKIWTKYEKDDPIATIRYPERYNLKTDRQRIEEAEKLYEQMTTVPSTKYQKSIAKQIAIILLDGKISNEDLAIVLKEINKANYISSDPNAIYSDVEKGILSLATAAGMRGYNPDEPIKAAKDHAERIARIQAAQAKVVGGNSDMDDDPKANALAQKAESQDADTNDVPKKKVKS